MNNLNHLQQVPLFRNLSPQELQLINSNLNFEIYGKGRFIFRAGQQIKKIYLIKRGQVRLFKNLPNCQITLQILKSPQIIKKDALFNESTYQVTAQTIGNTLIYSLAQKDLERLIIQNPLLSKKIIKTLNNSIRKLINLSFC
ncbi:Crp/Fnr family transcriptional regulator [Fuchsiella alkaliacetigena]|uniref:Crp/Fnr family transcriptional regulator n=1 Tax=Fuchsiella alkaliacetigena TaxID=957042 RepID=UPI00200A75AD|nr:cyclic nucleotide-binding domain-containing protein [Fuchsiella alkaliacetigena]MCK8824650.1 cyclic nucleotide-binding domain-containing protein [Fuchsiella alkaliacetigena]